MTIQTQLIKKIATSPMVCTNCNQQITKGEKYHLEEGVEKHLHSLIARKFCYNCYGKYGEKKLLAKEK